MTKNSEKEVELTSEKTKPIVESCHQLTDHLNAVEKILQRFKNGNADARIILRQQVNVDDLGYLGSLLTMICDEQAFQDWKAYTTLKFKHFRRS